MTFSSATKEKNKPVIFHCMKPDVTIIVGGERFHHCTCLLRGTCSYFDHALSVCTKEVGENIIDLGKDRSPADWKAIYSFLRPTIFSENEDDALKALVSSKKTVSEMVRPLEFMTYLGLDRLAKKYDSIVAERLLVDNPSFCYADYRGWCLCKSAPCPVTQKLLIELFKYNMPSILRALSQEPGVKQHLEALKVYLLDDVCGNELWRHLLSLVPDFAETLLHKVDQKTMETSSKLRSAIVGSHVFFKAMEVCGKDLGERTPFDSRSLDLIS